MSKQITIVSGLPRSGTSAMMQMLVAGGLPALTDNIRAADIDNPKGYFELDVVQKIADDQTWLPNAQGKVFKLVSPLLKNLPNNFDYQIIFMRRDLHEIIASQAKMIARRQSEGSAMDEERMIRMYEQHLKDVYTWMGQQRKNVRSLTVRYADMISSAEDVANKVADFLQIELDNAKMIGTVDSGLYRNKATAGESNQSAA